jgi:hypothetical protein
MKTLTTINTNIKEDHQREETVASSSINVLLNAKSVVRKDTMPRIATADTSNLVITHFWVTPKFFFFSSKKKKKPARCRFERHCAASSSLRMQSQGRRRFFENVFPAHFLSLPLHKTLSKPIPTQPYPANVTIKERDTMPCKHSRPPYPAEVRQPVPPLHHDGTE